MLRVGIEPTSGAGAAFFKERRMDFTPEQIERAADAMRTTVGGCRVLKPWVSAPEDVRKLWRKKARIVLDAALQPSS